MVRRIRRGDAFAEQVIETAVELGAAPKEAQHRLTVMVEVHLQHIQPIPGAEEAVGQFAERGWLGGGALGVAGERVALVLIDDAVVDLGAVAAGYANRS